MRISDWSSDVCSSDLLVAPRDIGERDLIGVFIEHARARLAEAERAALAAALHLAHEENPHADQQQHGEPGDEQAGKEGRLFTRLARYLNAVLDQFWHHPEVDRQSTRLNSSH